MSIQVNPKAILDNKSTTKQTTGNIDFITKSPYEILCGILGCFDINTICTCVFVCRAWRSKIINCHEPWRRLSLKLAEEDALDSENNIPFSSVSKYTHELNLSFLANDITRTMKLLQGLNFAHLRSLKLLISNYLFNGIILDETLYSTLSLIGASLKSLWIEWNCGLTGIKLNRILTACQNLTSVRCITNDITDWTVSHITTLRLIHLEPATRINSVDRLEPLLQHSPDLRHLELRCVHTLSILPTIHKYYPHPQLITLISNKAHFQRQFGPVRIPPMDMTQQDGKLQCLMLSAMGSTEKFLPSILENSRNTLQTLCLDIGVYHPRRNHEEIMLSTTWELPLFISSTPIPLLTYLHISDSSWRKRTISFFRDHLPNMLRCCPALTTLVLERFSQTREDYIMEDNIYTIIQQLTKLSCLRLINFSVNGPHFKRLLQHYAQIQTTTTTNNTYHPLRQLAILNNDSVTPVKSNIFWYVVRITSLEQLQLRCPHMDVTDADMADFTYFIRRLMTCLIHLELDSMPIHESAAENLARCDNLWTLTIHGNNVQEMTNEDIQVLETSGKVVIRRTNNS